MILFISLLVFGALPYACMVMVFGHLLKKKRIKFIEVFFLTIPTNFLMCLVLGFIIRGLDMKFDLLQGEEKMAAFVVPLFLFVLNLFITIVMLKYYSSPMKPENKLKVIEE